MDWQFEWLFSWMWRLRTTTPRVQKLHKKIIFVVKRQHVQTNMILSNQLRFGHSKATIPCVFTVWGCISLMFNSDLATQPQTNPLNNTLPTWFPSACGTQTINSRQGSIWQKPRVQYHPSGVCFCCTILPAPEQFKNIDLYLLMAGWDKQTRKTNLVFNTQRRSLEASLRPDLSVLINHSKICVKDVAVGSCVDSFSNRF